MTLGEGAGGQALRARDVRRGNVQEAYVPVVTQNTESSHRDGAALAKPQTPRSLGVTPSARMHDYRFKQMEYTLPEEYQDENELARQRKIHDSLITMGLQLISDSYLDVLQTLPGSRAGL